MTADLASTAASLLPLFVAVPLLLAGVSAVTRNKALDRILSIGVPVASVAGAIWLLTLHSPHPSSPRRSAPMRPESPSRSSQTASLR